jgi:hypothetical protein
MGEEPEVEKDVEEEEEAAGETSMSNIGTGEL